MWAAVTTKGVQPIRRRVFLEVRQNLLDLGQVEEQAVQSSRSSLRANPPRSTMDLIWSYVRNGGFSFSFGYVIPFTGEAIAM